MRSATSWGELQERGKSELEDRWRNLMGWATGERERSELENRWRDLGVGYRKE